MDKTSKNIEYINKRMEEYKKDIEIAINAIKERLLYPDGKNLICDLYAIPSHNYQAYFGLVYEDNGYFMMVYAKPQIEDIFYGKIKMYPFSYTGRNLDDCIKSSSKIIVGIKNLEDPFKETLLDLINNLPNDRDLNAGFTLDGVFQAMRSYEDGAVAKEYIYEEVKRGRFSANKAYLKKAFDDLYLTIAALIDHDYE